MNQISAFRVPLPPVKQQNDFVDFWYFHKSTIDEQIAALNESNNLFNSLLQRAFKGASNMPTSVIALQKTIIHVLQAHLDFIGKDPDTDAYLALDRDNHHYLLLEADWQNNRRIYGSLIHVDIIDKKAWIHSRRHRRRHCE